MSVVKSQKGKRKGEKEDLNYLMVNARLCTQMEKLIETHVIT